FSKRFLEKITGVLQEKRLPPIESKIRQIRRSSAETEQESGQNRKAALLKKYGLDAQAPEFKDRTLAELQEKILRLNRHALTVTKARLALEADADVENEFNTLAVRLLPILDTSQEKSRRKAIDQLRLMHLLQPALLEKVTDKGEKLGA